MSVTIPNISPPAGSSVGDRLAGPTPLRASGVPAVVDQTGLTLDDGTGLRVAQSRFVGDQRFTWKLFAGFTSCRILTYSVDLRTVNRLIVDFDFDEIECIIGTTATINRIEKVLAAQHAAMHSAKVLIDDLSKTEESVIEALLEGRLAFRVLRKQVSHSKLYLLDGGGDPQRRVVMGSANFSEQAFGGWQQETIASYDDDPGAWEHFGAKYREVRDQASQAIDPKLLAERNRPIEVEQAPLLGDEEAHTVLAVADEASPRSGRDDHAAIERHAKIIRTRIGSHVPPARRGEHILSRSDKRNIREALRFRPAEQREPASLSIDHATRSATFAGKPFDLGWDPALAAADARLMVEYFDGFDHFSGTPEQISDLKAQYFTLWAWLYFAPFVCELRNRAALRNRDVIRYERVAIVYGKANCGKSSLIATLLRSMFPADPLGACQAKANFKTAALLEITHSAKRCPVFFDDVSTRSMGRTGRDFIKDETPPGLDEYPAFVLSMNRQEHGFPDEIVKRALLIYTDTALPVYKHAIRQQQDDRIRAVTDQLSGHLYKRYLGTVLDALANDPLPADYLALSSGALSEALTSPDALQPPDTLAPPEAQLRAQPWAAPQTWEQYAQRRYRGLQAKLRYLLRPEARIDPGSDAPQGWWLDGRRVIVRERIDQYGRGAFHWDEVPSTIVDDDARSSGHTALHQSELEQFLTDWTVELAGDGGQAPPEPHAVSPPKRRRPWHRSRWRG